MPLSASAGIMDYRAGLDYHFILAGAALKLGSGIMRKA
jgi:hypothetical protein